MTPCNSAFRFSILPPRLVDLGVRVIRNQGRLLRSMTRHSIETLQCGMSWDEVV